MWSFILGLVSGGILGLVLAAIMGSAGSASHREEVNDAYMEGIRVGQLKRQVSDG